MTTRDYIEDIRQLRFGDNPLTLAEIALLRERLAKIDVLEKKWHKNKHVSHGHRVLDMTTFEECADELAAILKGEQ